ncbi:MAG: hypothetical protein JWM11_308 [Planctomycetaceae bacterium]|nr:hypothetical protein [Planctomycetaceae bacterium]
MNRLSLLLSTLGIVFCGPVSGQVTDARLAGFLQGRTQLTEKLSQRELNLCRVYILEDVHDAELAELVLSDAKSINELQSLRRKGKVRSHDLETLRAEVKGGIDPKRAFLEELCMKPPGVGGWDGPGILAGDGWGMTATRVDAREGHAWIFPSVRLESASKPILDAVLNTNTKSKKKAICVTRIALSGPSQVTDINYLGRNFDELEACSYQASAGRAVTWINDPLGAEFVLPTGLTVRIRSPLTFKNSRGTAAIVGRLRPSSVPKSNVPGTVHPYEVLKTDRDVDSWSGWYEPTSPSLGFSGGEIRFESFEMDPMMTESPAVQGGMTGLRMLGTSTNDQTAFTWRLADGMVAGTKRTGDQSKLGVLMSPEELGVYQEVDRAYRAWVMNFLQFSDSPLSDAEITRNVGLAASLRRNMLRMISGCVIEDLPVVAFVSPVDRSIKIRDFRGKTSKLNSIVIPKGWTLQSYGLRNVSGQPVLITIERSESAATGVIRAYRGSSGAKDSPLTLYEFDAKSNACWGTVVDGNKTIFGAATNAFDSDSLKRIDSVELCLEDVLK